MILYAASNNEAHFTSDIFKIQPYPRRYVSPHSDPELQVSLPVMGCDDIPEAMARAKIVGRLPGYILDDGFYEDRKDKCTVAMTTISQAGEIEKVLKWDGMTEEKITPETMIPGCIFAVYTESTKSNDGEEQMIGLVKPELITLVPCYRS